MVLGQRKNQSTNHQVHSLQSSHLHQLHISQSDIAPRPNVHWMMHGGEACHHPATFISKQLPLLSDEQYIANMVLGERIKSIVQIHSRYPSHSHQLHISQSDIEPRPNARTMMPSGEGDQTATFISTHLSPLVRRAMKMHPLQHVAPITSTFLLF
jgi:hypothetical protein